MSEKNETTRDRSRLETRRRLMAHGLALFSSTGVAETRAVDIAHAAGVAVGTLYLHFGDKAGLLREILLEGSEILLRPLRALREQPAESIEATIRAHTELLVTFTEKNPLYCRVLFDPESVRTRLHQEILQLLVDAHVLRLQSAKEMGWIPPGLNLTVAAQAIVGMVSQVLYWWTEHPEAASRDQVIETLTRLRAHGLRDSME
jgi:AcrR family transcriptional regulator